MCAHGRRGGSEPRAESARRWRRRPRSARGPFIPRRLTAAQAPPLGRVGRGGQTGRAGRKPARGNRPSPSRRRRLAGLTPVPLSHTTTFLPSVSILAPPSARPSARPPHRHRTTPPPGRAPALPPALSRAHAGSRQRPAASQSERAGAYKPRPPPLPWSHHPPHGKWQAACRRG